MLHASGYERHKCRVTSRQSILVLQQGCLDLWNNFADKVKKKNCGGIDSLKSDAEPLLLCKHKFIIYFQAQKHNTSTPPILQLCINKWGKIIKNPRELYHNTAPATTCQKSAAARGNLGKKEKK